MIRIVTGTIGQPGTFFEEVARGAPKLGASTFVLVTALVAAVSEYFATARPQAQALGADTGYGLLTVLSVVLVVPALTLIGFWVFGLVGRIGVGLAAKPWAVVGYSFTPQLLAGLLVTVLALFFSPTLSPVAVNDDPQAFAQASLQLTQELSQTPLGRARVVLNYGALVWQLVLIFLGLRATTGVLSKAVRGAALVSLTYIVVTLVPGLLIPFA